MHAQNKDKPQGEVDSALAQLNRELRESGDPDFVKSFYLEFSSDYNDWIAQVIWQVATAPNPDGSLAFRLDLCERAGNKLGNFVAMTFCDYTTDAQYRSEYSSDYWSNLLTVLPDDDQQ